MHIRTTYFYAPENNFFRDKVRLEGEESEHLALVLRGKPGDDFLVTDGVGNLFLARIESVRKNELIAEIIETKEDFTRTPLDICLALGSIRPKNAEIALDWCVQLGITAFVQVITEFTVRENTSTEKFERLEKVALRAMKQAKRTILPAIYETCTLTKFLAKHSSDFTGIIFADEQGLPSPPKRMTQEGERILLVIGCEGGFSANEHAELNEFGAVGMSLGNARLRTETAAVVALTKLLVWSKQ